MVLMKKVVNANPGDADHVGGNDWDKLADFFNDINVSEVPRINTPTEFRSGILNIRDGTNAFNVTIKSATQTANRDYTIPALIGNDSPATLALSNNFTAVQRVTLDADTLLNLYRPVSTTNALTSIAFNARNSSNVETSYASIANRLIANTAGDEDGKLVFYVRKDGVLTEVMSIDKNGLVTAATFSGGVGGGAGLTANTFTGVQTISAGSALPLLLYRAASTATNKIGIDFQHNNASSVQKTFGNISTQLVTNTAGAEDGKLHFSVMKAGTLTEVMTVDKDGLLTVTSVSGGGGGGANAVTVLVNTGTVVTTASTVTEFDMLNYTVLANSLGANGIVRVKVSGYLLQNQATATNYTLKIKFGGTTIYNSVCAISVSQSSTNMPFRLIFELGNKNSTSSQGCSGHWMLQDVIPPTTGEGEISDMNIQANANFRTIDPAKATTSNQTLQVTMTHSVNSANVQTSVQRRVIEFIPGA